MSQELGKQLVKANQLKLADIYLRQLAEFHKKSVSEIKQMIEDKRAAK